MNPRDIFLFLVGCGSVALLGLPLAELFAQEPETQGQPPTFRSSVNYVEVDVQVTDRDGHVVRDLTAKDFQVLEDGQLQTIDTSTFVDLPVRAHELPVSLPAPDVSSNAQDAQEGRVYLLVLDDLHTPPLRAQVVQDIARLFVERSLGMNDRAAIVVTSGRPSLSHDFTSNRTRLIDTIERFVGQRPTRSELSIGVRPPIQLGQGAVLGAPPPALTQADRRLQEQAYESHVTLTGLKSWAEWMAGLNHRRKNIVFVSQGIDYDMGQVFSADADQLRADIRDTVAAAARNNVTIYGVDPRGLPTGPRTSIRTILLPDEVFFSEATWRAKQTLRLLSEETGGFAVVNTNEFGLAFDRIVLENSSYYLLGYYAPREVPDGELHRIEVRVNRPGVVVRSRRSYVAVAQAEPRPTASDAIPAELANVLGNPLPQSGLTLAVSTMAFRGPDDVASVMVAVESDGWGGPVEHEATTTDVIVLSILAVEKDGDIAASRQVLRSADHRQRGLHELIQLQLESGDYQVRVGALDRDTGLHGSVLHDVTVPTFSAEPIAMSDLVIALGRTANLPTVDEAVAEALPVMPTTIRTFTAEDELVVFGRIYDNGRQQQPVAVTSTVSRASGEIVSTKAVTIGHEPTSTRDFLEHTTHISLGELDPGPYVLTVEARSSAEPERPTARRVLVRVTE